jgi:hypothetical protein
MFRSFILSLDRAMKAKFRTKVHARCQQKGKISLNWLSIFLVLLIIVNIFLIFNILLKSKNGRNQLISQSESLLTKQIEESNFYDSYCPDIEMIDINGQRIKLNNLAGDVILLRFTRFHPQDIPYLLFLDHLGRKYKNKGFHYFTINSIGRSYSEITDESFSFSGPIIDDDGYIAGRFQVRLNETILVGRNFRIKIKSNRIPNRMIYSQVARHLFGESIQPDSISNDELTSIFKKVRIKNDVDEKMMGLDKLINDNSCYIGLIVSPCFDCRENRKIQMLKQISDQEKVDRKQIILLFGQGNSHDMIKTYCERNELFKYMTIGII